MDDQKSFFETEIKKWTKPEIKVLDISATKFGSVNGSDGEGADEDIITDPS